MSTTAEISEPASELERLIANLSGAGLQEVLTVQFLGPGGESVLHRARPV